MRYYELHAESYAARFDKFSLSMLLEHFIANIVSSKADERTKVLDVGCGSGRDMMEFVNRGIAVTGIDASPALLRLCNRKLRAAAANGNELKSQSAALDSICFEMTFDEIRFREQFDGVWASASLLHVPPNQLETILRSLIDALKSRGLLFMSFQYGSGQIRRGGRTFTCYDRRNMTALLKRAGLAKAHLWLSDSNARRLPKAQQFWAWTIGLFGFRDRTLWLNVLVSKPPR